MAKRRKGKKSPKGHIPLKVLRGRRDFLVRLVAAREARGER